MNWVITELHNLPLILCGVFYSILCIFSIVTGLIYASGRKELNPLELSNKFMEKLSNENKMKAFTIKMGWVTFIVGIIQGLTALAIFKGYNVFLNIFAISFTIFSICSVIIKLKGKINLFPIIKLVFYIIILVILLLGGINNYSAIDKQQDYVVYNTEISNNIINESKVDEEMDVVYIKVNNNVLNIELEENFNTKELIERLKSGDVIINAHEYGGFEKVGNLGFSLPKDDKDITTSVGDIVLYQGNQVSLFYNSNSWSYTKIGRIINIDDDELRNVLGNGDVTLIFTLSK